MSKEAEYPSVVCHPYSSGGFRSASSAVVASAAVVPHLALVASDFLLRLVAYDTDVVTVVSVVAFEHVAAHIEGARAAVVTVAAAWCAVRDMAVVVSCDAQLGAHAITA